MSVRHECERKEFVRVRENNGGWEVTVKGKEKQLNVQSSGALPCIGVGITEERVRPVSDPRLG